MDDWVILAKTRWALRRVVQQVNTILDHLKLEKHPDKTFIGRIDRGFDFLGYRFVADGLRLAAQTKQRFCRASHPALRARCGSQPHRGVRSALVDMGPIWWPAACLGRASGWGHV